MHTKEKGKITAVPPPQDEDDVPTLINPDLPNLKSVIDRVDVVIEVLDARDPMACRSSQLEEYVTNKDHRKLLLVLNKIGMLWLHSNLFSCVQSSFYFQIHVHWNLSPHGRSTCDKITPLCSSARLPHFFQML